MMNGGKKKKKSQWLGDFPQHPSLGGRRLPRCRRCLRLPGAEPRGSRGGVHTPNGPIRCACDGRAHPRAAARPGEAERNVRPACVGHAAP